MTPERELCRARDLLAECDDANRVARLLDLADAYERYSYDGSDFPEADLLVGQIIRLIADADLTATGQLSRRRMTGHPLEPVLGPILDRMAAEPDLTARAFLVREIREAVDDDEAAESIAHLPYGTGMVGGDVDLYLPNSFPKMVRTVWRAWRDSRAA